MSEAAGTTEAYHLDRWETRWSEGTVGWDQDTVHPALVDLLLGSYGDDLGIPRTGKAVVPGCGRGYDVDLLARRGLDTIGVDISPTGVQTAQAWIDAQPRSTTMGKGELLCADVLKWAQSDSVDKYEVILDYTFLCALPPTLRPQWVSSISNLAAPRSTLITLMYPLFSTLTLPKAAKTPPPWPLTVELYHEMLDREWDFVHCTEVPEGQKRKKGSPGGETLAVWRLRK